MMQALANPDGVQGLGPVSYGGGEIGSLQGQGAVEPGQSFSGKLDRRCRAVDAVVVLHPEATKRRRHDGGVAAAHVQQAEGMIRKCGSQAAPQQTVDLTMVHVVVVDDLAIGAPALPEYRHLPRDVIGLHSIARHSSSPALLVSSA